MSSAGEIVIGLAIAVGIAGVVVPILPGGLLVGAAIGVWAALTGGLTAWSIFAIAAVLLVAAGLGKYVVAERHLRSSGVPRSTMFVGAAVGVVGFFAIPIVGLVVGFILGVYAAERYRLADHQKAWRATVAALKASGLALLIELAGSLLAASVWVSGLAMT
ncbi:MAG TPA: DUF456 domain-containing protein [Nocardioidaceae bacterium]|nr:DUF456 domain-containing protein [Nocardioidaceae bacterium]